MPTVTDFLMNDPRTQAALKNAADAEAAEAADLQKRTDAQAAELAAKRQAREAVVNAEQQQILAELRQRRAAQQELIMKGEARQSWVNAGGDVLAFEDAWPGLSDDIIRSRVVNATPTKSTLRL